MSTETSPTSRALLALELIQANPGVTAERLAGSLGVTERAARRYVGILREAEIPILSARGPYGGYTVGRGVRLPPLIFSATEALGLVMAALDAHYDAADPTDPVGSALGKILRALPEPIARQAEAVRQTAHAVPDRYAARPDPATTAQLVEACSSHRLVRLGYRSEAGSEWVTQVEPWAVVARHGRWYLLCRLVKSQGIRTYRLDRVQSIELLDDSFEPPAELDPVSALEENLAAGWEYPTEVMIEASIGRASSWLPRSVGRLDAVDDHRCRLTGTTSTPDWYAEVLAGLPVPFHVVGGPELRHAVRELGNRMLAAAGTTP
ncbi:MAG: WYL domain-containing protein [Propionibacteriaceae bacterium]|nr:WYL domain-containing protein [Propionibacteriaceae bacterium]